MKHRLLFAAKQFVRAGALLLCISMLAFVLVSISPIDPLQANVGQTALGSMSAEQIEKLERYWGVDEPLTGRYFRWVGDLLHGNFGESLLYRRPVAAVLAERLQSSLGLMAGAWILSGAFGVLLGVVAGAFEGCWPDRLIRGYALLIASTPAFWLALLLLIVFAVWLGVLPVGLSVPIGMESAAVTWGDRLRHAALPVLTLSMTGVSAMALHTREKLVEVLHSDYAWFARARGESTRQIVLRHGLRGILLPAITLQFASISEMIGGSVLVEQVFSYPGLGQAAVSAGLGGDLPLLLGITLASAALVIFGNVAANLLYGMVDPRIRRRDKKEVVG